MNFDREESVFKRRQSWRIANHLKDLVLQKKYIAILITAIFLPFSSNASVTCRGHFVNPITDVCWSCLMPISIGGIHIGKGGTPKKRDTKNPKNPVCLCSRGSLRESAGNYVKV